MRYLSQFSRFMKKIEKLHFLKRPITSYSSIFSNLVKTFSMQFLRLVRFFKSFDIFNVLVSQNHHQLRFSNGRHSEFSAESTYFCFIMIQQLSAKEPGILKKMGKISISCHLQQCITELSHRTINTCPGGIWIVPYLEIPKENPIRKPLKTTICCKMKISIYY